MNPEKPQCPYSNPTHIATVEQYKAALLAVRDKGGIRGKPLEMLKAHFRAPFHTTSSTALAKELSWTSFSVVNLHYGTLASDIAHALHVTLPPAPDSRFPFSSASTKRPALWSTGTFWSFLLIKAGGDSVKGFGFLGDKFEFYRFANRYRMAVRFSGIQLDGFGEDTERGYSALTRTFFAWSVFERYTDLAGIHCPYAAFFSHVPRIELSKLANLIDRADSDYKLFDHLRSQSLPQNQDQLDRFRSGDRRAVVFYAAAIRHIYVHGHLGAREQA